jgi:sulfur carrier protein ThiS
VSKRDEEGRAAVQVAVILFGPYAGPVSSESGGGRTIVQIDEPASVAQVLDQLQVPPEGRTYVTVNGTHASLDRLVSEADEIRVVVPLGGG